MVVPFELRPSLAKEGVSAHAQGLAHSEHVEARLLRIAGSAGHPMVLPDLVPNTHLALALGERARDAGDETHIAVHGAIFDAYFRDGRDIGSRDVLLDVAVACGLDADDVVRAWDEARHDERLRQMARLAGHLGAVSVPAALICNELLIGTRPYGILHAALEKCLLTPQTLGVDDIPGQ